MKVNDAPKPGAPRLQMAKTGSTIGEANVIVSGPVNIPSKRMMSRTVLGEVVTVPPMKELSGAQRVVVPFVTVPLMV